ncbi:S8 family serine peptidase [Actinomadura sp. DC4]|uniref:S8 family serine peptidase n=1 Tax=Actinomadura sp. DC4 TaxID=3055069 RepID=UPI0025B0C867|nr:S8 family serine peptidase [Actinomadura sp. DC4]MDN3354773.1 S8 family serine peptidase [Actinomadura sp. DC4]
MIRSTMAGAGLAGLAGLLSATPAAAAPPAPLVKCAAAATQRVPQRPWAQAALAPERAWNLTDGRGVVVAVLGTGVDASVPQLTGHVTPGRDVASGGRADTDCVGTGTFAAGLVAARRVEGVGMTGVAPGVTVLPVRVARDGEAPVAAGLAAGIDAAVAGGAKVVAVAVKPVAGGPELTRAVRNATAHGVLVVAPAAESGDDRQGRFFPAADTDALSVAATDQDGEAAGRAGKGVRVDLAAPGKDLLSLGTGGPGQLVGSGNEYAAAYVAGSAALVRAYHPRLSVADVKRRLENAATRPGTPVPDPGVGWGVVNPYEAVSAIMTLGGDGGAAPRVTLPPRVIADHRAERLALLLIVGVGGAVAVIGVAAAVIQAGRRRGWQAGVLPRE